MKKRIFIMACITLAVAFSACGKEGGEPAATPTPRIVTATPTPTNTPTPTDTPKPTNTPTPTPDLFNGDPYFEPTTNFEKKLGNYYLSVFEKGLLSTGNSYRLREKLAAAQRGEEITVAYFGGSVTVGEASTERTPQGYKKGYAYISYEYIRDTYGTGDNVKYINSAISGTGSDLGMVRADEDILAYKPDIIFIEFAVNNDQTLYNRQTYEGLIRKFLKAENEPAVILLFSAATYAGANQDYMKPMGTYYDLPMVSMKNALSTAQNMMQIKWSDFSGDSVHPKTDGHKLYAKLIAYMIKEAVKDTTDTGYTMPGEPSLKGWDLYEEAVMINNLNTEGYIKSLGCFEAVATTSSASESQHSVALKKGWTRQANSGSEPLRIEINCSSFSVVVKQANGADKALEVYVDGKLRPLVLTQKSGAWNNPVTSLVFVADEPGDHVIEIKPAADSVGTTQTILGMAYTR